MARAQSLTSPCISKVFSEEYTAFAGACACIRVWLFVPRLCKFLSGCGSQEGLACDACTCAGLFALAAILVVQAMQLGAGEILRARMRRKVAPMGDSKQARGMPMALSWPVLTAWPCTGARAWFARAPPFNAALVAVALTVMYGAVGRGARQPACRDVHP